MRGKACWERYCYFILIINVPLELVFLLRTAPYSSWFPLKVLSVDLSLFDKSIHAPSRLKQPPCPAAAPRAPAQAPLMGQALLAEPSTGWSGCQAVEEAGRGVKR